MTYRPTNGSGKAAGKPRGRPFPPGNNANPNGRPPVKFCLTDLLREAGKELAEARFGRKTVKGTNAQLVAARLWALARAGNVQALKVLYDRCDGLAKATLEVQEPPTALIRVVYAKPLYDSEGNRIAERPEGDE